MKPDSGNSPDPRIVYADIIDLPHHQSAVHPRMSLHDRAAQFSPFAALSGYEDMVGEEARLVDRRIELCDEEKDRISRKLNLVSDAVAAGMHPAVSVTYFVPDPLKDGGRYETVTEAVRKVDTAEQRLYLMKTVGKAGAYASVALPDILDIRGDVVEPAEE